jgi:hypothetical protein
MGSHQTKDLQMRKTNSAVIASVALVLATAVGWTTGSNRLLQAKPSTAIEPQIDTFSMMASGKDLPTEEFQDFSLVFSAPVIERRSSLTP